jgi:ketosteroid isomerase-like protein
MLPSFATDAAFIVQTGHATVTGRDAIRETWASLFRCARKHGAPGDEHRRRRAGGRGRNSMD